MAFSILQSPDAFALTKAGRMMFTFSGNARVVSAGTKAINELAFTSVIEGTKVVLTWNGRSYTYIARSSPTNDTEFPTGNGNNSAYVDSLAVFFASRYEIREDFVVSRSQLGSPVLLQTIVLTAKQAGPNYNLTPFTGITNNFSVGISTNNTTPGVLPAIRPQYGVHAEIWLENLTATAFDRIYSNTVEADDAGLAQIDVGSILHSEFDLDWPAFSPPATRLNPGTARRYYVAYAEAYGSPQQIGAVKQSEILRAYYGGADYINRAGSGFPLLSFVQTVAPAQDFGLRFGSPTRYVLPTEPQFLTFLNARRTVASLLLEITVVYDNNTSSILLGQLPPTAWPFGSKITIPVGPQQLNLSLQQGGATLREYTVRIREANTTNYFSTNYRYILNYAYEPYARFFAYESSLGVIDTLVTFGKGSAELNRFSEQAEQYLPASYVINDGQFVDYDLSLQQQLEVTTGFRAESELAQWNDFYRSARRLLITDGRSVPISLVSKSIKQAKDDDNQFAHKFEFVNAYRDEFFTGTQTLQLGDPIPPLNFQPAGTVVVAPPSVVTPITDPGIPQVARDLTATNIVHAEQSFSWGNHAQAGYLTEQLAAGKYAPYSIYENLSALPDVTGSSLLTYDRANKQLRVAAPEEVREQVAPSSALSVDKVFVGQPDNLAAGEAFELAVRSTLDHQLKPLSINDFKEKLLLPIAIDGKDGIDGIDGINGKDGAQLLTGAIDPAMLGGTVGNYRDLYLNSVTGDLFQRVNDLANSVPGAWVLITNLRGPRGLQGPAGPPGSGGSGGSNVTYMPVPQGATGTNHYAYFSNFPQPGAGQESYVVTWQTITDVAKSIFAIVDALKNTDLSAKVDKVDGKGLSTNDYTAGEKQKLAGLSNYTLPVAKANVLGGVKVGAGINLAPDGTISVSVDAVTGLVTYQSYKVGGSVPEYAPILDMMVDGEGTLSHVSMEVGLSQWVGGGKKMFDVSASSRDGWHATIICQGDPDRGHQLVAYRLPSGVVRVFIRLTPGGENGFPEYSVCYEKLWQCTPLVTPANGFAFTTDLPPGTLLFDSGVSGVDLAISNTGLRTHLLPAVTAPINLLSQNENGTFQRSSVADLATALKPYLMSTPTDPTDPGLGELTLSVDSYDAATGSLVLVAGNADTRSGAAGLEYAANGLRNGYGDSARFLIPDYQRDGSVTFTFVARQGSRTAQVTFTPYLAALNWPGELSISSDINSRGVVVFTEGLNAPQGIDISVERVDGIIETGTYNTVDWRSGTYRPMLVADEGKWKLKHFFIGGSAGPGLTPGQNYVFHLTNKATGQQKSYPWFFPAGANTDNVVVPPATDTTSPTTPTTTTSGTLLAAPGRTPVRQRQRVRVYNNGGKKADIEVLPAAGWRYKWANTSGAYDNQFLPDWESIGWTDLPASGILTVNAPGNDNDNTTVVRIARTDDPSEIYDTVIRMVDTFDWLEFGGAAVQLATLAGPRILNQTRRERLHLEFVRFEGTDSIWKDTSGHQRGTNAWYWVVGGSHRKIADNAPLGELRLAQGIFTMVYRAEVLPGIPRETGLLHNKTDGSDTGVVSTDAVILYTGKP